MRRTVLLLAFFSISASLMSQLASWNLTTNADASQIATNVNALPFVKGTGTGTLTIGSTGAYCSGWTTAASPDPADYFQIAIAPQPGYKITLNTIAFSERRSATGPLEYQLQYDTDSLFSNPVIITTFSIPDNDLSRDGTVTGLNIIVNDGDTLYLRWYGYLAESSAGTWRINAGTLFLNGTLSQANPNDNDSYADAPSIQLPSDTIDPSAAIFKNLFRFKVTDAGTADAKPTEVTLINISNANPAGTALWSQVIDSVLLKKGNDTLPVSATITDGKIYISLAAGSLTINDGNNTEIDLLVKVNTAGIVDLSTLQFKIPAANPGWDAAVTGSGFAVNFPADIISSIHTINIQATKYTFSYTPPSIWQNASFTVQARASDSFGNFDNSYNESATISLDFGNGNLSAAGGLTRNFSAGVINFNDIVFDGYEWIRLRLEDDSQTISPVTTNIIFCAQDNITLNDNFNSGDFPENPVWIGNTSDFVITTDTMLHLSTTSTGDDTSYVVTPVSFLADSIEWSARVKLLFDPSSSNYTRFYLVSDNPILTKAINGYYIQIGETGSTDAIEMFRLDNGVATSLMRGPNGQVAISPNLRLKIVGYNNGTWKLYVDLTGNFGYQFLAGCSDLNYILPRFFTGFYCKYSQSYASGKFYFDDAYCGPVIVDTIAPSVISVSLRDSATLDLVFSEAISESDAQNITNYFVSNSVGNPVSATQQASDKTKITLTFSPAFQSGNSYLLTVSGLKDLAGNIISASQHSFSFYKVKKYDVVINEILADPSPPFQLPEWEFIELYNRSACNIDLNNWRITVGSSYKTLPLTTIPAGGYLILTHTDAAVSYQSFGSALGIFTSSILLTNSGAIVELKDDDGQIIHSLTYSDTWFNSTYKKDGGWSLEQIDPANPCGEGSNWKESVSATGGTPGTLNSVNAVNPDNQKPSLLKGILVPPDTLNLYFSEILDTSNVLNTASYSVDYNVGNPASAVFSGSTGKIIKLRFNHAFGPDTIFTITVNGQITDCVGNIIPANQSARFALTELPVLNEIVINEVLFDPKSGGVDFVEVYNRSQKVFNMSDVKLVEYKNNIIEKVYSVTSEGHYIFAGNYVVITTNPNIVAEQYNVLYPSMMIKTTSMPSLNNESGRVTITNRLLETIDDFSYTDDMHFQLLSTFDGISLERINYNLPTQDAKNWHSAAQIAGFATPTYKNSQYAEPGSANGNFSLEPEIFSPDMDGYNDQLYIHYSFDNPGFVANITIFDAAGRKVRSLIANELLATSGFFVWDGLDNNDNKAMLGMYIVYAEVFDLNGTIKHYKKTCVLASKNQ